MVGRNLKVKRNIIWLTKTDLGLVKLVAMNGFLFNNLHRKFHISDASLPPNKEIHRFLVEYSFLWNIVSSATTENEVFICKNGFKWQRRDSNSQPISSQTNTQPFSQTVEMIELCCEYLSVRCIWLYVVIISRTSFRVNPHSIVRLNVKEPLARSRRHI